MHARRAHPLLLLLVLLAHVIACWMLARHHLTVRRPPAPAAQRITFLKFITPPAPQPRQRATVSKPAAPSAPRSRIVATPTARVQPASATEAPAIAAAPAPDPAPAPHHLSGAEILEQARRDMPRIERELRKGVPTKLTLSPDSLRYKLEHGIDDAYVGGDQRAFVDFYTSPDNMHYTRITQGGKVRCTVNGGPVSLRSAMGGGGGDTRVKCPPPDAGWKDMPWVN